MIENGTEWNSKIKEFKSISEKKQFTSIDYKKRVFHAMNYISRNIKRDLSLEEIAETASFSMFHFHRIFKAVAGETVAGFTRRLRLELAANRLLSVKQNDITTIAMDCGFSSSQNFAKAFRIDTFRIPKKPFRKVQFSYRPLAAGLML